MDIYEEIKKLTEISAMSGREDRRPYDFLYYQPAERKC